MEARSTLDTAIDEAALAFVMLKALQGVRKAGWDLREDLVKAMRSAAMRPMGRVSPDERVVLSLSVDSAGKALLDTLNGATAIEVLLATSYLATMCADEGLLADVQCQPVLVGLTLLEEAKEDLTWRYNARETKSRADRMLMRGRLLGRFGGLSQTTNPLPAKTH
jgi:hypothetical protein